MKTRSKSKKAKYDVWVDFISSQWFSIILLNYLRIDDIARFDSAVCDHYGRKKWLDSLKCVKLAIEIQLDLKYKFNKITEWMSLKKIQVTKLSLVCLVKDNRNWDTNNNEIKMFLKHYQNKKIVFFGPCSNDDELDISKLTKMKNKSTDIIIRFFDLPGPLPTNLVQSCNIIFHEIFEDGNALCTYFMNIKSIINNMPKVVNFSDEAKNYPTILNYLNIFIRLLICLCDLMHEMEIVVASS